MLLEKLLMINIGSIGKLVSFILKCESVQIEDLPMTMCNQTYKVETIPICGHVSDNLFAILGQKVEKSVL